MATVAYKEAYSEVLDILNHTRKEDVNKISPSFLDFLKSNSSKSYVSNLDHSLKLKDMNLKPRTKAILAIIYREFWCNEEQLKEFDEKLMKNEMTYQNIIQKANDCSSNNFEISNKVIKSQVLSSNQLIINNDSLIPHKESFFSKIINRIKSLFKK